MLLANGLVLVTVMLRVITDDGSIDGTNLIIIKLKEGSPTDDGFVQLRLTVSEPMSVTLRLVGSLGGARVKIKNNGVICNHSYRCLHNTSSLTVLDIDEVLLSSRVLLRVLV